MKTIWISYAWMDNKELDVDFVAQELTNTGLKVNIDKWSIGAGKRLWEQIENFIMDPSQCDGWILIATKNSLVSEPCREEFAYALDRALQGRGEKFPIIGLFPSSIDYNLIPVAIRTRLYINLADSNWKERIKAAVENRLPDIAKDFLQPYVINFYSFQPEEILFKVIEVRPRVGTWSPAYVGIALSEKETVKPWHKYGPAGVYNLGSAMYNMGRCESEDSEWWLMSFSNEVNPTNSIFLMCEELPSKIAFGVYNGDQQFSAQINKH